MKPLRTFATFSVCSVVILVTCFFPGCSKKNPVSSSTGNEETQQTLDFSGYKWHVKSSSEGTTGPGGNYFSSRKSDVWVDDQGQLHLKIVKRDNRLYCTEVFSEKSFGYGQYVFYLASRTIDNLDPNVVLGLFTWDDNTCVSDANSEIDIEFAKWGKTDAIDNFQYVVQPTEGGGVTYDERSKKLNLSLNGDYSTHIFNWTPDIVEFRSYHGHGNPTPYQIASRSFDYPGQCRIKNDKDCTSDCIYIPKPSPTTNVHMNLWLIDDNNDILGDNHPKDENIQEVEVVVKRFEFIPLSQDISVIDNNVVHIHFNHDEGRIDTLIFKLGSNRDLIDQYWDNANHCGLGRIRGETGTSLTNYSIGSDSAIFEYQNASYGTKRFKLIWSTAKGFEMEMVFNLTIASSVVDEGATWEPGGDNDGNDYIKIRKADLTETTFHYTYPGPSTGIWDGQALGTGSWDADYDEVFGYKYSPAIRTTFSNGLSADGPFHYLSPGMNTLNFAVKKANDFWIWLGN